ncbi:STAS domain-containing protein [Geodermatophilus sp. DSM 45219]|nr:STAS domain-containing protein [Geodermatophilus sp. DSM 45219]
MVALQSMFPAEARPDDVPELSAHLDLVTGRVELVGRLDRATAHLLHDAVSALLVTSCAQWTVDVTRATVGDHHGLRALAVAYRRAGRHHRQFLLLGASPTVQRAALQLGGSEPSAVAGQVCPN